MMTLYAAVSLGLPRFNMGDIRDQLIKIKSALGFGENEKKGVFTKQPKQLPQKKYQSTRQMAAHVQRSLETARMSQVLTSNVTISQTLNPRVIDKTEPVASPAHLSTQDTSSHLLLPSFTVLARISEFKQPESWVAHGVTSQLTTQSSGRRSDIFIGLDFGTAFTKAAVQILDNIYPVDWNGIAELKDKYLLPSEYSETNNKECHLGQHPSVTALGLHTNLKRAFITQSVSDESLTKAIIFVSLVIQYIRAWVYQHHKEKLGSASLGWHLNIGIPSDVLDKAKHVLHYKKIAAIAWTLSLRPKMEINFDNASHALAQPVQHHSDLREVSPIPELVAQLSGYSRSARRQNGLHVLVDIGGGTVDMVTFNVHHADGDDVFPFFVANVRPLGSYALLEHRFQNLPQKIFDIATDVENILTPNAFAIFSKTQLGVVQNIDTKFFKIFKHEFESLLGTTHLRRYPSSPNWKTGIRTFISGGGALIPGYKESIRLSSRPNDCPLLIMDLPPHPKLSNFDQNLEQYSRISVACGLAEDSFSLGTIRPASEVEDVTPLTTSVNRLPIRERPDRDELYPK